MKEINELREGEHQGPFRICKLGSQGEIYFNTDKRKISLDELVSAMEEILDRQIGEKNE